MNFELLKLTSSLIGIFVIVLFIITPLIKILFKKLWLKSLWLKASILFAITHFILVNVWAVYVSTSIKNNPEFGMLWAIFLYSDFPISFLIWPIGSMLEVIFINQKINFLCNNLFVPYFIFSLLGSLQYFLWGGLIGKLIEIVGRLKGKKGQ